MKKVIIIIVTCILLIGISVNKMVFSMEASEEIGVIPKPLNCEIGKDKFILNKDTSIYVKGSTSDEIKELQKIAYLFTNKVKTLTGLTIKIVDTKDNIPTKGILLETTVGDKSEGDEGYKLAITGTSITVNGNKPEGVFRGTQTLLQLIPLEKSENYNIQSLVIKDKPEYTYRGFMLDVARHFYTVGEVKRQIDLVSQYKINRVHLHLSDDQGWRLEIKKYPDLTIIGGSTQVGGGPGGYYTQEQFKDIVNYAKERYIEIIPEFDMPGHCNAALASYGFLNPDGERKPLYTGIKVGFSTLMTRNEKTYEFIDDIFKEVSAISPSKYLHVGGDEADSTKKEDYDYFVGRVTKLAEKYGKVPIGWDPIDTSPNINSSVVLQNWKDSNEAATKKSMKMIISIAAKSYLDMKYNKDTPYGLDWAGYIPVDVAYNWDPTDYAPKELVLGIEAPLWTETIANEKEVDYMVYPRLLGYAEIGWTPKSLRNWEEYKVRLKKQEPRLNKEKVNYYKGI